MKRNYPSEVRDIRVSKNDFENNLKNYRLGLALQTSRAS